MNAPKSRLRPPHANPYLYGYVTIAQPMVGIPKVLGTHWSQDYPAALEIAARSGGSPSSRNWVKGKTGTDPVATHALKEIVVPKNPKTKKLKP